jgi:soluble lytic murein transglycosylase-like protein
MRRHFAVMALGCAAFQLSCAMFRSAPPEAGGATGVARSVQPMAPDEQAQVEAQLRRYQTRLAADEIRVTAHAILEESQRHQLDHELLLALMRIESGFNNFAVSHAGALGLMQVMPGTGREMAQELGIEWRGPGTLFDPVDNVRIGAAYLAQLRSRFGSLERALAAYNWGPHAIDRRLREGQDVPQLYVTQVLAALEQQAVR